MRTNNDKCTSVKIEEDWRTKNVIFRKHFGNAVSKNPEKKTRKILFPSGESRNFEMERYDGNAVRSNMETPPPSPLFPYLFQDSLEGKKGGVAWLI